MKPKLTPIKAAVLAAVIGATYSEATYYITSQTCVSSGNPVDAVAFWDDTTGTGLTQDPAVTIYASGTWYSLPATTSGSGPGYTRTAYHDCDGAAYFTNPVTGASCGDNETFSYWQYGLKGDGSEYPSAKEYLGVLYGSGT
jgi:hypothetical protein